MVDYTSSIRRSLGRAKRLGANEISDGVSYVKDREVYVLLSVTSGVGLRERYSDTVWAKVGVAQVQTYHLSGNLCTRNGV